jgi:hypothetical protein
MIPPKTTSLAVHAYGPIAACQDIVDTDTLFGSGDTGKFVPHQASFKVPAQGNNKNALVVL